MADTKGTLIDLQAYREARNRAPLPDLPPTPGNPSFRPLNLDRGVSHPGYGLTPEYLAQVFQAAESGWPMRQCDLFEDLLENDPHAESLHSGRVASVAGREMAFVAGAPDTASKEAAIALNDHLSDNANFLEALEHQLDAEFYGWAATEIHWRFRDGLFYPQHFDNVAHRRFRFDDQTDQMLLLNEESQLSGEALRPGQWITSRRRHRKSARAGLLRVAAFFMLFKRMGVRDWVITMEKFGIPSVVAHYDEDASKGAREVARQALRDLGEAGFTVVGPGVDIKFEWAPDSVGKDNIHDRLTIFCEAQMSKLVNGATLTTDTGGGSGSHALGNVHKGSKFILEKKAAKSVCAVIHRDVAHPFTTWNGFKGATPPKLKVHMAPDMDPLSLGQLIGTLAEKTNLKFSAQWAREHFGFPEPIDTDDEFMGKESADGSDSSSDSKGDDDE